eukprot:CAMPEP_0179425962 /NCGR_PEP_ID=MMETSP0799-20121207/12466_1 /TAXON_ID=46947 /ORGANISM="Geminigera cryophila, Strain CCMP2564" /LENGTH=55 /DNA_ID=CAMNT_0021200645 /DNA_START=31 /DNA_END=195 /DNA_ORIENTATION=+
MGKKGEEQKRRFYEEMGQPMLVQQRDLVQMCMWQTTAPSQSPCNPTASNTQPRAI